MQSHVNQGDDWIDTLSGPVEPVMKHATCTVARMHQLSSGFSQERGKIRRAASSAADHIY